MYCFIAANLNLHSAVELVTVTDRHMTSSFFTFLLIYLSIYLFFISDQFSPLPIHRYLQMIDIGISEAVFSTNRIYFSIVRTENENSTAGKSIQFTSISHAIMYVLDKLVSSKFALS